MIGKVIVKNTNTEWFIIHHSLKEYKEKMQRKKKV